VSTARTRTRFTDSVSGNSGRYLGRLSSTVIAETVSVAVRSSRAWNPRRLAGIVVVLRRPIGLSIHYVDQRGAMANQLLDLLHRLKPPFSIPCHRLSMTGCEHHHVDYVFGLARNARLESMLHTEMQIVRSVSLRTGRAARLFRQLR
jgi:hypothetical protein